MEEKDNNMQNTDTNVGAEEKPQEEVQQKEKPKHHIVKKHTFKKVKLPEKPLKEGGFDHDTLKIVLFCALAIILIVNMFLIINIRSAITEKTAVLAEAKSPAEINLITITDKACTDCFKVDAMLGEIKLKNVKLLSEKSLDSSSDEAKQLITKYKIEKLPALIVTGETKKAALTGLSAVDDALVLTNLQPPYVDLKSNEVKGRVNAVIIKAASCKECGDMKLLIGQIKEMGVSIKETKEYDYSSSNGKSLVEKYKIEKLPAIILSKDVSVYSEITEVWNTVGTVEKDGSYVFREASPPYYVAASGKVYGLVSLIMLSDKTCSNCYNASLHKSIMARFGLAFSNEKEIDVSEQEGRKLISDYNITKVPTIIMKGDLDAYEALGQVWSQVGTVEKDGAYVFRQLSAMGGIVYKDLTTNKVVTQQAQS